MHVSIHVATAASAVSEGVPNCFDFPREKKSGAHQYLSWNGRQLFLRLALPKNDRKIHSLLTTSLTRRLMLSRCLSHSMNGRIEATASNVPFVAQILARRTYL
jgi:hypothetical protein